MLIKKKHDKTNARHAFENGKIKDSITVTEKMADELEEMKKKYPERFEIIREQVLKQCGRAGLLD